jgi:FKBP-type peptidyl-prolyl cis-trans isomerase
MFKAFPIVVGCTVLASSLPVTAEEVFKDLKEKTSYSIGITIGGQLGRTKDDIDFDKFMMGLKDAYDGAEPKISAEEMQKAMATFRENMQKKQMEKQTADAEQNKKEGDTFLAENKKKEGVKVLESGLQYKVLKEGKGELPKPTDTVVTHYKGNLIGGEIFDSSYDRGQPATFPVNGVIKAWTEALQQMKVGSKWQLFVPPELGYGQNGAGQKIGPNAVLIFEIELLEIKKPEEAKKSG